ncbi:zinc-binding dehydrogenase [Myroides fluvii]|uniref:zinc-binding dehydrogenase n=1 Tax=Myroides fluvii TaxID=2572594 RepID=UPI00131EB4C9|nr:zinc-binding dehydrogenase [Myroides fluvii]
MTVKNATAFVFDSSTKTFESKTITLGSTAEGETVVEILYTTICTSDLHTYCGRRPLDSPTILGHEIVGRITHLPTNTTRDYTNQPLALGDLITWCVYTYDEHDPFAQKGYPQKSISLYKYGHHPFKNKELNGGFATHCILKQGTALFKLNSKLSLKEAAPLNCTHATIAGGIRLAGPLRDKTVLIYGAGMLGLSAAAQTSTAGAKQVILCDINAERLAIAKKFGAHLSLDSTLPTEEKKKILADLQLSIDIVLDTTGIPAVMQESIELLDIGGISIWIGAVFHQDATPINAEQLVRKLLTIKGLHNYIPEDLATAIQFLEEHHTHFPFGALVHSEFHLKDLADAFQTASTGQHFRVGITPNTK